MANLPESENFDSGVYQLEISDPVQGGVDGVSNTPLKNLANRTKYLKKHVDDLESGATIPSTVAPINSPALTGNPTAPTAASGDNDTSLATTAFVQRRYRGRLSKDIPGGSNVSLTADETGYGILAFTGTITANIAVIVPDASGRWVVENKTVGAFTLTIKTAVGTGVTVEQGKSREVYCDATNVYAVERDYKDVALTGTPTAPTANPGTTSTQVANAAFLNQTLYGMTTKDVSGGSTVTLTAAEAANGMLVFTGTLTAPIAVEVPTTRKHWIVRNDAEGDFSLTLRCAGQTGVPIPKDDPVFAYSNGTDVALAGSGGSGGVTDVIVEEVTLTAEQTVVDFATVTTTGLAIYIEGAREFDYTVDSGSQITLGQSYPEGTKLWGVQNDPNTEITAESIPYGDTTIGGRLDELRAASLFFQSVSKMKEGKPIGWVSGAVVSFQVGQKVTTGGTVWQVVNTVTPTALPGSLYARPVTPVFVTDYSDASDNDRFTKAIAAATPGAVWVPVLPDDGFYDIGTLSIDSPVRLIGEKKPTFNHTALSYENGTILKGQISCSGTFRGVRIESLGVDAQAVDKTEGIVLVGVGGVPLKGVSIYDVSAAGSDENNHVCLCEIVDDLDIHELETIGGTQGLAVKATNFSLGRLVGIDNNTWAFTARYSPTAPCYNGFVSEILSYAVNNAKAGGVICMNDQTDVALKNITFDKIKITNGSAGFYITNGGNAVGAENVVVNDLYIEGVTDFAIQTFGPPKGFKVHRAHIKDCSGSMYTNGGACEDYELKDFTLENTSAPALLSGTNHKASGWTKQGSGGPSTFIQNESTNLQVFDMDQRVGAVVNQNGGTTLGSSSPPATVYPANGSLPAMVYYPALKIQKTASALVQNGTITLYTLPASSTRYQLDMMVTVISTNGTHHRRVAIARQDIQYLASSTSASAIFEVQKTGDNIELKYIHATTSDVNVNVVLNAFHEQ